MLRLTTELIKNNKNKNALSQNKHTFQFYKNYLFSDFINKHTNLLFVKGFKVNNLNLES